MTKKKREEIAAQYGRDVENLWDIYHQITTVNKEVTPHLHARQLRDLIVEMAGHPLYATAVVGDSQFSGGSLAEEKSDAKMVDMDLAVDRHECHVAYEKKARLESEGLPVFSDVYKNIRKMLTEMRAIRGQAVKAYRRAEANATPVPAVLRGLFV